MTSLSESDCGSTVLGTVGVSLKHMFYCACVQTILKASKLKEKFISEKIRLTNQNSVMIILLLSIKRSSIKITRYFLLGVGKDYFYKALSIKHILVNVNIFEMLILH